MTPLLPPPADLITSNTGLFLDFDGTLAPIQDDADTVTLAAEMASDLLRVAAALNGALAVLSGRGLSDLSSRVPVDVWRFGNHGLYEAAPGSVPKGGGVPSPGTLLADIDHAITPFTGVFSEAKGPVIAIHYRANPEAGPMVGAALSAVIAGFDGYNLQHGKCVYEAKPAGANKGLCLQRVMLQAPFAGRVPVMFGDDTTDEDAFVAAQDLGGVGVKVGAGPTCASFRLPNVDAVHTFLKESL